MKGVKQHRGYTIVEVMIVLAVSGVMFVIAASFVSGKQAKTAFTQGVNTMAANLQSSIEDVIDGHYSDVPVGCTVSASSPRYLTFTAAGSGQGTNQGCVFLGQLFHFNVTQPGAPDPLNIYEVFSLAGAKTNPLGGPSTALNQSALTTVTAQSGNINTDFTKHETIPQGLDIEGVLIDGTHHDVYNLGFVQGYSLTASATDATAYTSGAQTISMISNLNATGSLTSSQLATAADGAGPPSQVNESRVSPIKTVVICVTDGTRHANITIGDNGNQLKAIPQLGSVVSC
jgi:prepilin-type N-terminal cleavage/methylation domain-containing protein